MTLIVELIASIVLLIIGYKWYKFYETRKKLAWVTYVPGWPILGNALEFGDNSEVLYDTERLIRKHGKLIQFNFLFYLCIISTDYDFIEFILSTNKVLNKTSDYRFFHRWLGTGLLTSDGTKWKKRRRLVTPAFHFSILEQFVDNFEANGKILIEKLENEVDKDSIDIYPFITVYTLDIICETAMGVKINAQLNTNSEYQKNVKKVCSKVIERAYSLVTSNDFLYLFTKDYREELKAVHQLHSVTNSVIDARKKEIDEKILPDNSNDDFGRKKKMAFLDILLQTSVEGEPLSREDIREEVDTFMFEGHDTTSSAISFALYLLSNHPDVQNRALEEQKLIFDDDINRNVTYNDLQEMKYLECVIKESLRLYPSVPMFGRCTNTDVEFKGNIIPRGTDISIFAYGVLRDPDNFPDPEKFNPSRFEEIDGKRPYAFIPFSAGPRNCIGQKFAMLEIKSTLSKILRNFELKPTATKQDLILVFEAVLKSKTGIRLKLEKRKW